METKVCKGCGRELPINAFRLTRWGKTADTCGECITAKLRETKTNKRLEIGGG